MRLLAHRSGLLKNCRIGRPGLVGPEYRLTVHTFDATGDLADSEEVELKGSRSLVDLLSMITGQSLDVAYRELILVNRVAKRADDQLARDVYRSFGLRRRQVARELRQAGLF